MRQLSKTVLRCVSAAAIAAMLSMGAACAQDAARMEDLVQSYVKTGRFMGAVLVWKDGKALLDKGYGFANLEWQIPNTPDTKFRLGSMTKQFTAASILLLQQRGKLNVKDPIKKYLPDAPAAWDKITLYHLLTHTSGIPNFTEMPDYRELERKPAKPEEMVAWFKNKPLEFSPGSKWRYTNSGYTLLGVVIEMVSGMTYRQFVTDNIFKPLGMKDSGDGSSTEVIARHASGYAPGKKGIEPAGYIDMTVPYAAGGLYSTTHDILLWEQGLFGGKVLNASSLKMMTAPFLENYGCGLWIQDAAGHKKITHGGAIEGFNTQADYLPADNIVVVVLGNLSGMAPSELTGYLGTLALNQPLTLASERKAVTIDPKSFDAYTGVYQFAPQVRVTFTRDGERYYAQVTNQPRTEIFPLSGSEFFAKVVDATFRFETDAQGKTRVYLHQAGRDVPAEKVEP